MSGLGGDIERGTGVELWTLGHSKHDPELFLGLLRQYEIALVIDVRSIPYSQWTQPYNKENLERLLSEAGLRYDWRGDDLGGIPTDQTLYDDEGHTIYEPLAATDWFRKAIGGVEF